MHRLKEFERPLSQMQIEIERMKIGRSSGNYVTVTKPASASSSEHFTEGSKEKSDILAQARRCCALKNRANPIKKGQIYVRLPLKSSNIPLKVARYFSIRVNFSVLSVS
jgi:hypothetical protein